MAISTYSELKTAVAKNWTRENLAWAAGLFEGEGSIDPKGNRLSLTTTDLDVLNKFLSVAGCGHIYQRKPNPLKKQLGKKTQWTWVINRQEYTQALLAAMWEWLGVRRRVKAEEFFRKMATPATVPRGQLNGNSKLTENQAREIFCSNERPSVLARKFGVTITNVLSIRNGETWRHIHGH